MFGALEDLTVVDFSRLLPGPFASQVFADYGADVVKVEEPGRGDYLRAMGPLVDGESRFFLNLNRNKRSFVADLKSDEGRRAVLALVDRADVLLESFRPGVMERLGLGSGELLERKPDLVYCSLTGYGRAGPYAHRAGHDINYLAVAGVLGQIRDGAGRPVIPGLQIADVGGGALNACLGVLMALHARHRTGRGQVVDAAMVDGVASWLVYPRAYLGAADATPGPHLSGEYPCYAVYEASDGGFLAVGALEPKFWGRLCRAVGHPEWEALQFRDGVERDRLFDDLRALFRTRSRDEWAGFLEGIDCCVTPVLELGELAADPYWQARAGAGSHGLGFPVGLSSTPPAVRRPPPRLGEHTAELLGELGYGPDRIRDYLAGLEGRGE